MNRMKKNEITCVEPSFDKITLFLIKLQEYKMKERRKEENTNHPTIYNFQHSKQTKMRCN